MFYYRIKENGDIIDSVEFKDLENIPKFILEQYLCTDRKIVRTVNGELKFEDEIDIEQENILILNKLKDDKIYELKTIRDTEEVKPIEYEGKLFDFDEKARDRINSAIIALSITGQSIEWTTADNTNVLVTADDLRGIVANVAVRSNELHVKYRELKERVENCTTKEELDSIKWDEENSV